jgi:hypothetical protein
MRYRYFNVTVARERAVSTCQPDNHGDQAPLCLAARALPLGFPKVSLYATKRLKSSGVRWRCAFSHRIPCDTGGYLAYLILSKRWRASFGVDT